MLSSSPPLNAPPAAAAAAAAGLDSLAALKIAETLHDFCTTGMIVLCTMYVACLPTHPHLIDIPTTPPPKKKKKAHALPLPHPQPPAAAQHLAALHQGAHPGEGPPALLRDAGRRRGLVHRRPRPDPPAQDVALRLHHVSALLLAACWGLGGWGRTSACVRGLLAYVVACLIGDWTEGGCGVCVGLYPWL